MQQTDALLDRFLTGLAPLSPVAVWAHGSLAGGDYVEGRSDLDLIAVLPPPIGPRTVWRLAVLTPGCAPNRSRPASTARI